MPDGRKDDRGKPMHSLLPLTFLDGPSRVFERGGAKYGLDNWKEVDNWRIRYSSALLRHLFSWLKGERKDPESGESHLAHACVNLIFLIELEGRDG